MSQGYPEMSDQAAALISDLFAAAQADPAHDQQLQQQQNQQQQQQGDPQVPRLARSSLFHTTEIMPSSQESTQPNKWRLVRVRADGS